VNFQFIEFKQQVLVKPLPTKLLLIKLLKTNYQQNYNTHLLLETIDTCSFLENKSCIYFLKRGGILSLGNLIFFLVRKFINQLFKFSFVLSKYFF